MDGPERELLRGDWLDEAHLGPDEDIALPDEEGLEAVQVAHRSGWRLLRQEPGLAFWVVGADMLSSALRALPIIVLLMGVVAIGAGHDPTTQDGLVAWGVGVVQWLLAPATVVGTLGMFAAVLLSGWVLSVATTSGVLGALRHRLLARTFIRQGMFFKHFGAGFSRLLWWDTLRTAVVVAGVVLTGLGVSGVVRQLVAAAPHGHWASAEGSVAAAAVLAVFLTLGTVACLMLAALFHLALGPMVIRDSTVGDALAEAVALVRARPYEVLILYVIVALLFGAVLCVYLPVYAVAVMLAAEPSTESIASLVQLGADMFLLVGGSAVTVWARGSVLSYVAMRDGILVRLPPAPQPRRRVQEAAPIPTAPVVASVSPGAGDLVPAEYPNVFSYPDESVRVPLVDGDGDPVGSPPPERDGGLGDPEDDVRADEAGHDDAGVESHTGDDHHDERHDDEDHALAPDPDLLEGPEGDIGDHQPSQDEAEDGDAQRGGALDRVSHGVVRDDDGDQ